MSFKVVGIDIGYHNLGLVSVDVDYDFNMSINFTKRINLTKMVHDRVQPHECKLHHTNELCDMISHFVQEYGHIIDDADHLLLERHPPGGLTNVEALLMHIYRDKVRLIAPVSMHKHFSISHLEYEERKVKTEELAFPYLMEFTNYMYQTRKHDMADAMCMVMYYVNERKDVELRKRRQKELNGSPLEQFRFVKKM